MNPGSPSAFRLRPGSGARAGRERALQKYFSDKLFITTSQISILEPGSPDKRGQAMAVVFNATPGGGQ